MAVQQKHLHFSTGCNKLGGQSFQNISLIGTYGIGVLQLDDLNETYDTQGSIIIGTLSRYTKVEIPNGLLQRSFQRFHPNRHA